MATDPAEAEGTDDDDSGSGDHEEIRSIVREEIHAVLDGLTDLGGGEGGEGSEAGGDTDPEPTTLRAIEEATRKAVEAAMEPLRADIKKRAPAKKAATTKKPEPEPAPVEPARKKFMEKLWS
jgi:hypothetical protein